MDCDWEGEEEEEGEGVPVLIAIVRRISGDSTERAAVAVQDLWMKCVLKENQIKD